MKRVILLLVGMAGGSFAAVEQEAQVVSAAGGSSTGAGLSSLQCVGQPSTTTVQQIGDTLHQTGFLGFVLMRPDLDTDEDGIPDELDGDNDGDTLTDVEESTGAAFSPATVTNLNEADSDGDGATDAEEAEGGFNPLDANRLLEFDLYSLENGTFRVRWLARAGRTYGLYRFDLSDPDNTKVLLHQTTPLIGQGPWLETKVTHDIGGVKFLVKKLRWFPCRLA